MTTSGDRTEQLQVFCRVTGFMSGFLSFIVVEHIRFFHGAIQLIFLSVPSRKIVLGCFIALQTSLYVPVSCRLTRILKTFTKDVSICFAVHD